MTLPASPNASTSKHTHSFSPSRCSPHSPAPPGPLQLPFSASPTSAHRLFPTRGIHVSLSLSLLYSPLSHSVLFPQGQSQSPPSSPQSSGQPGHPNTPLTSLPPPSPSPTQLQQHWSPCYSSHIPSHPRTFALAVHLPRFLPKVGSFLSIMSQLLSNIATHSHSVPKPLFLGFRAFGEDVLFCWFQCFLLSPHQADSSARAVTLVHLIHHGNPSSPHRARTTVNVCLVDRWMDEGQDPGAVGCQILTASLRPPPGVILPAVTHQAPVIIKFLQCFGKWGHKGVQTWGGGSHLPRRVSPRPGARRGSSEGAVRSP